MSVLKAHEIAVNYHYGQMYGDKIYMYHLQDVESKCRCLYKNTISDQDMFDLICVAILHDVLEDTDCEYETIGHACGWKVADAVVSVTKVKGESYKDYIKRVRANDLGLKVKIADTLCNLEESIKISDMKRIKKYTKQLELLCKD